MDFLVKDGERGKVVLYRMEDLSHQVVSQITIQNQHIGLIMTQIGEISAELNKIIGGINKVDGKQATLLEEFLDIKSELSAINENLIKQNQQYNSLISVFNQLADEIREVKSEISARKHGPFRVPATGEVVSSDNVVEVIAGIKEQLGLLQRQTAEISDAIAEKATSKSALTNVEQRMESIQLEMTELQTRTNDRLHTTDTQLALLQAQLSLPMTNSVKKRVKVSMPHQSTPDSS